MSTCLHSSLSSWQLEYFGVLTGSVRNGHLRTARRALSRNPGGGGSKRRQSRVEQNGARGSVVAQDARSSSRCLHASIHQMRQTRGTRLACSGPDYTAVVAAGRTKTKCYKTSLGAGCTAITSLNPSYCYHMTDKGLASLAAGCMHRHHHPQTL